MSLGLITNRTQTDVDRVKELRAKIKAGTASAADITEYLSAPIGDYCSADVNRVNGAINTVATALTAAGYPLNGGLATNWTDDDEFLLAERTAYLGAVAEVRSALAVYPTTPAVPNAINSYTQANDIEQIIEDVYQLYLNMVDAYYYLGDLYLGEV